jgi:hypothetical protein
MHPRMAPITERDAEPSELAPREDQAEDQAQPRGAAAGDVQLAYGGVAGASSSLPHLDQIQRSFGDHDVRGVRAAQGGEAEAACDAMGAEAYATGDRVAFGRQPDLHTAAHEAAHVVQQRAGGAGGDPAEHHADRVADAVVAGEPADYLLSQVARPGAAGAGVGSAVQLKRRLPRGEEAFQQMWDAHPHNYQTDDEDNTSSDEVRSQHGLPAYIENTCAVRISIMLNNIGERITPQKTAAAGLRRAPHYSRATRQFYILAASEMWTYLNAYFRRADATFPASGRYRDAEQFQDAFESTIKPRLAGHKGIVAFDKVFSYGGTGHVDLFDGEALSNAAGWYPSQRLMLWYIAVPQA